MKLKDGRISLLVGADSTTIELIDAEANIIFAKITLTPLQLSQALSRNGDTECSITVRGLDNVGKKQINATHEFEIPENIPYNDKQSILTQICSETIPEGWVSDDYFNSQNTFFKKDGKSFARTTIRKWD